MASSGLYRRLVESSAEGLWALDNTGRTVFANARLAEMLGVPRDEMVGRDHADFLDADGREQWHAHLARLVADPTLDTRTVDCQFVRGDGTPVWFLVSESRLRDEDGTSTGLMLSLSEFDDRRRLESELAESRRALLEAQRIARLGSWSWDRDSGVITLSPTVRDFLRSPSRGQADADGLALVDTFGARDREVLLAAVEPLLAGGDEPTAVELAGPGHDGPVWIRVRAEAVRGPDGEVAGLAGTVQDVTDSRSASDVLRDIAHQNHLMQQFAVAANEARTLLEALETVGGLLVTHDDWIRACVLWVDPDAPGGLQAGPSTERDDRELPAGLEDRERATAVRAVAAGAPTWDDRHRLTLACPVMLDGAALAVVVLTSAPPLHRHELIVGMVQQVTVQLSTVAERESTARELATTRDAAMEASRQKSEFLATMSHEIRTPLNGVIGLNDLLRATTLDPHQQRLASGVGVSGRALLGIVDDILDFSKIEAGLLELEEIDLEPRQVLDDVAAMTAEAAYVRGVDLVMHCDRGVPGLVRSDRVRLTQVVSNLVSNAVKFSEGGEVVVRVTSASGGPVAAGPSGTAEAATLRFEVRDRGVGIAPERVEGIFDPFVQADASTTREYGGTGLGLAIVREIVTALGGDVGVESQPGVGSTFWFTAHVALPIPSEHADVLRGRSVVLVDDHDARRAADVETLAHWGMEVTAMTTDVAVAALAAPPEGRGCTADLIVVSPTPDGPRPGTAPAGVPVVRLRDAERGDAVREEDGEFLERPVPARRLRAALEAALGHARPPSTCPDALGERRECGPVSVTAPTHAGTPGARGRVLVVEDTPVNQMVAEGMLTALGCESESVDDGQAALERLADDRDRFDLVLMDVQMPRLDGYATSRAIREREREGDAPRLPIVAMTAAAVTGERERCLEAGMDDFLTKPVSFARLATVLTDLLPGADARGSGPTDAGRHAAVAAAPDRPPVPVDLLEHLDVERLDMLRDLDPGNTAYVDRVIGNFVTRTPDLAGAIRDAVDADDPGALTATAHRLLGSALNLGVPRVAEVARELESLGDSGGLQGAAELTARLETELISGRAAVLAYRESHGGG